jgi:membrane-bound lytic murein transglycosylase B
MGVRKINGEPLADSSEQNAIFLPAGARGPAFLLRDNFYAILKYNFATSYALAVSELADRYKGSDGIVASWPRDEVMLNESQRMVLQQCLTLLGFDTGGTDGVFGRLTRQALREYQKARGIPADGFPTAQMLTRILNERYSLP